MSFAAGRKESLLPDQKGTGKFARSLQKTLFTLVNRALAINIHMGHAATGGCKLYSSSFTDLK
jgi:hypothetical protein